MNACTIDQACENAVTVALASGLTDDQILEVYLPQYERAIRDNNWAQGILTFSVLKRIADRNFNENSTVWNRILDSYQKGVNGRAKSQVNEDLATAAEELSRTLMAAAEGASTQPAREALTQFNNIMAGCGFETESV